MIQLYNGGQQIALYEILEEIHIEAGNGSAYFNTGYKPIQSTEIECQYKCMFSQTGSPYDWPRIFATMEGMNYSQNISVNYEGNVLRVAFNGETYWRTTNVAPDTTNINTVLYKHNQLYYNGTLKASGSGSFNSSTTDLCINADNGNNFPSASVHYGGFYYYRFKIYEGTTLVRDYKPAKRLSDSAIGFYDVVNDTFLENSGTVPYQYTSKTTPEYIYGGGSTITQLSKIYKITESDVPVYEKLDYITTNQNQYLDSDIYADINKRVVVTAMLTSRPGNSRIWSTHDPIDYSGQNWAFASGTWGLQFEGTQMCIKPLGTSANDISSFAMLSYYWNNVSNQKLKYDLYVSGELNIYNTSGTSVYYYDCSDKTDINKVSQTTIRFFAREASYSTEWMVGRCYDIEIYDNNDVIRHYIPVKRLSDNKIGFYEEITGTFLTSGTSSDFSGTSKSTPDYIVEHTKGLKEVNRIYNNGEYYWGGITQSPQP